MARYKVEISTYTFTTIVKAKSEKEAKEKAEELYIREGRDERNITIWKTKGDKKCI